MHAHSLFIVTKSAEDGRIEGIASTPTPDRMLDVVEPRGAKFKLPIPLLWQHSASDPIGHVTEARVADDGIHVVATVARTLTDEIARRWQLIRGGLVRGLSIGFRGLETERIRDGGVRFKSWEWLELSAVTIPANAEANIQTVKAFDADGWRWALLDRVARGESIANLDLRSLRHG